MLGLLTWKLLGEPVVLRPRELPPWTRMNLFTNSCMGGSSPSMQERRLLFREDSHLGVCDPDAYGFAHSVHPRAGDIACWRGDNGWLSTFSRYVSGCHQVINWLFAVHGGGIAGTLTFASAKNASFSVLLALIAFSLGLVMIVCYGAFMYYLELQHFSRFRSDVFELYGNKINWPEFIKRETSRPEKYRVCEVLAWSSGGLGLLALISLAVAIL